MKNGDFWGRELLSGGGLFFSLRVQSGLSMRTTIVRLTTIHNLEHIVNMQKKPSKNEVNLVPFLALTILFRLILKITFKGDLSIFSGRGEKSISEWTDTKMDVS